MIASSLDVLDHGAEDFVFVPNVQCLNDGLVLMCELEDGRWVGVPPSFIGHESGVRFPGDRGTLAVRRWFAQEQRLPIAAAR